jgi:hypothetical protein
VNGVTFPSEESKGKSISSFFSNIEFQNCEHCCIVKHTQLIDSNMLLRMLHSLSGELKPLYKYFILLVKNHFIEMWSQSPTPQSQKGLPQCLHLLTSNCIAKALAQS